METLWNRFLGMKATLRYAGSHPQIAQIFPEAYTLL
jgi:hypothetical protein